MKKTGALASAFFFFAAAALADDPSRPMPRPLPRNAGSYAEINLATLQKKLSKGTADPAPWAGFWWPYVDNGIADDGYDRMKTSPADKLDRALGNGYWAAAWENRNHGYGRRAAGADNLIDLYFDSRSEGFGPEVKRRVMLGTFALSSGYYEAYYGRARGVLERMRQELASAFEAADLVVTPTSPSAAFRIGEKADDPLAMYLNDIFTTPASLAGLPAAAVPSGLDEEGLPLSLQLTGRPFAEALVLRAARAFESQVGWTVAPGFRGAEAG